MLAILPLIKALVPYAAIAGVVTGVVYTILHLVKQHKTDKMEKSKEQSLNQISQLNSVKQVEDDMAQATTNHADIDTVITKLKNKDF